MNFTSMDITKKIDDLRKEKEEQQAAKDKAHARITEINRQIGKLETIIKHASEILEPVESINPDSIDNKKNVPEYPV